MSISVQKEKELLKSFNVLDLLGVAIVLISAFYFQFLKHEIPCPLCLLQRFGFFLMAFGLLMNLTFDCRTSYYAFSAIGAMYTAVTALRQMLLHVVPGTGSYGSAVFGLHMYTWSFIISSLFLLMMMFALLFEKQFSRCVFKAPSYHVYLVRLLELIFIALILVNVVSIFMECGLLFCPDNPVHYKY